jgi:cytochrome c-type biogenesis protein CcmF
MLLLTLVSFLFANPFLPELLTRSDGLGLNPLLVNPWMAIHPPVLFIGYAAALPLYCRAVMSIAGQTWEENTDSLFRNTVLCAGILGAGIALGGAWAYETLGWGGFWGWDPVENGSLITWLLTIASVHSILFSKTGVGGNQRNMILVSLIFPSIMLSVFLTRSGALENSSVHSFASSQSGFALGIITALSLIIPLFLLIIRRKKTKPEDAARTGFLALSLRIALTALIFFTSVVAAATLMPVVLNHFAGETGSLQSGFFNDMAILFITVFFAGIIVGSTADLFKREEGKSISGAALIHLVCVGAASVIISIPLVLFFASGFWQSTAIIFAVMTLCTAVDSLIRNGVKKLPSCLSHAGLSIFVIGVIASSGSGNISHLEIPVGKSISDKGIIYQCDQTPANHGISQINLSVERSGSRHTMIAGLIKNGDAVQSSGSLLILHGILYDIYITPAGMIPVEALSPTILQKRLLSGENVFESLVINIAVKWLMTLVWLGSLLLCAGLLLSFIFRMRR